jgi:hypothetical protein
MRRTVLFIILIVVAGKYGLDYILSADFQNYGDRTKAQWTCQVNNVMGGLYEVGSEYQKALNLYERTIKRCPQTPLAENAMFHRAACMEVAIPGAAMGAYQEYLDAFPDGEKRASALRSIDRIRLAH